MYRHYLRYFVVRALQNIRENRFLTLVTVAVITVSMLLFSAFLLLYHNLEASLESWGHDVQVSAYLRPNVLEAEALSILQELEQRPEVSSVAYTSPAQALESFKGSLQGIAGLIEDLNTNPLPASLEIKLKESHQELSQVEAFVASIQRPEFEDIDWSQEWVEKFYGFLNMIRYSGLVLGGLLAAASIFIISQTIRLGFFARRDEFEILELVGATATFIRVPFVIEGFLQGLTGAVLAEAMLYVAWRFVSDQINRALQGSLGAWSLQFLPTTDLLLILLAGMSLGLLGSLLSIRKVVQFEVS